MKRIVVDMNPSVSVRVRPCASVPEGTMKKRRVVAIALAVPVLLLSALTIHAQNDDAEAAALASLDDYMAAFNARDDVAWAATLHYPHVRIAGGDVRVWQTAQEYIDYMDFDAFAQRIGWDHSEWDSKKIIQSSQDKVHVAVQFTRYDKDNNKIATYKSLYIQTLKDGKWGTQARSSFAP